MTTRKLQELKVELYLARDAAAEASAIELDPRRRLDFQIRAWEKWIEFETERRRLSL
ncbi:MAG: hypothetical protein JO128_19315 [Alphaproteobacteria bacterium]|nr:hypothetical protein [Alphaproteobacteria bacterium]